jgi:WD40 repeat protein
MLHEVGISPNGDKIISASLDGTIKVHNLKT